MTRQENIDRLVGHIAQRSGLELTTDHIAVYGGWLLAEGTDHGGISTSTFGSRRRPYGEFVYFLEAVLIGQRLASELGGTKCQSLT